MVIVTNKLVVGKRQGTIWSSLATKLAVQSSIFSIAPFQNIFILCLPFV